MVSGIPDDAAVTLEAAHEEEAEKGEGQVEGEGEGEEPFVDPLAAEMEDDKEEKTDPEVPAAVDGTVEESVKSVSKQHIPYRKYSSSCHATSTLICLHPCRWRELRLRMGYCIW